MQGFPTVFSFGKLPFYGNVHLINNRDCVDDGLVGRESRKPAFLVVFYTFINGSNRTRHIGTSNWPRAGIGR